MFQFLVSRLSRVGHESDAQQTGFGGGRHDLGDGLVVSVAVGTDMQFGLRLLLRFGCKARRQIRPGDRRAVPVQKPLLTDAELDMVGLDGNARSRLP